MTDHPYKPPLTTLESDGETTAGAGRSELLPYAQLGIRLLGVMFFVDGLSSLVGGFIQNLFQTWAYAESGYDVAVDPHSAGWAAGGVPYLFAGIYLLVGGNRLLYAVFTSSSRPQSNDEGNRDSELPDSSAVG